MKIPDLESIGESRLYREKKLTGGLLPQDAMGAGIFFASLGLLGPGLAVLHHFDTIKPLILLVGVVSAVFISLWRSTRLIAGGGGLKTQAVPDGGVSIVLIAWGVLGWLVARQVSLDVPLAELGVAVSWAMPALYFLAAFLSCKGEPRGTADAGFRRFLWWLAAAGVVQACLMLLQRVGCFNLLTAGIGQPSARMIGTIGYHNQAADFVGLAVLLLWHSGADFRLRAPVSVVLLLALVLTGSRGAIGAVFLSLLLGSAMLRHVTSPRVGRAFALAVVLPLLAVAIPSIRERFLLLCDPFSPSSGLASRLLLARVGWHLFLEQPWIGAGGGRFALNFLDGLREILPTTMTHRLLQTVVFAREPHNDYLQFAMEYGLVGLTLVLVLGGLVAVRLHRNRERHCCVAGMVVLFYMSIQAVTAFPWQCVMAGPVAAIILGYAAAVTRNGSESGVGALATPACAGSVWLSRMERVIVRFGRIGCAVALLSALGFQIVELRDLLRVSRFVREESTGIAPVLAPWSHAMRALSGAKLLRDGKVVNARRVLEDAWIGYRDINLLNNLGASCARGGDWQGAASAYRLWARTGIEHKKALSNLATALENAGGYGEAAAAIHERFELWPANDNGEGIRLAALLIKAGQPEKALAVLAGFDRHEARLAREVWIRILNLRAGAWLSMGRKEEARPILLRVLLMDPGNKAALENSKMLE